MDRKTILVIVLLQWYVFFSTSWHANCHRSPVVLCREKEKKALLTFKQHVKDPSSQLSSWTSNECCTWKGISCDNMTGHVIKLNLTNPCIDYTMDCSTFSLGGYINDSLKELDHLQYFDLSFNNFEDHHIPSFLGSFQNLKYLSLTSAGPNLRANSLEWLSNLSSLEALHLRWIDLSKISNSFQITFTSLVTLDLSFTFIPISVQVFFHLPTLRNLYLSDNNFNIVPNWLHNVTNLESLDLSSNSIQQLLSNDISCFSHLSDLDLFNNKLGLSTLLNKDAFLNMSSLKILHLASNAFSVIPYSIYNLTKLEKLDLSDNHIIGILLSDINYLSHLTSLRLSSNKLKGKIPIFGENLCNLHFLDFSFNNMEGELYDLLGNSSTCIVNSLKLLDLGYNSISGTLPNQIGEFQQLYFLNLKHNLLSGLIPISIGKLLSLSLLDLSDNQLNESIPTSFGNLSNLENLDISNNTLEGLVSEVHFSNLRRLKWFSASSNWLNLTIQSNWIPPFQLQTLKLESWQVGPRFPAWIESQKDLRILDLSNSRISDVIPLWFWSHHSQFDSLDLSHNHLHGNIPSLSCQGSVILHSNNFFGLLPHFPPTIEYLDLSNNLFHGALSRVFCEQKDSISDLKFLDLSGNMLNGELPDCWMNYSNLEVLHLRDNNLVGSIPSSLGALSGLYSLSLYKNSLFGNLPSSLRNSTSLNMLDLSENNFSFDFPIWLGKQLPPLRVLMLRSNMVGGNIPREICDHHFLQILDLSENNFSGSIPRCFGNFSGMMEGPNWGFSFLKEEKAYLVTKSAKYEYSKIPFFLVTSMDLSSNSLTGKIPEELTNLYLLRFLNLSNNQLQGRIPKKIGAMKQLEALDVSINQLTGLIPQSMTTLTFLDYVNFSYNDFSGKIPTSTQLQSFGRLSFVGNQNLCGPPLTATCLGDDASPKPVPSIDDGGGEKGGWMDKKWFYIGIPFGFVVGFWGIIGPLAFNKAWRYAYYKFWVDVKYQLFGGI